MANQDDLAASMTTEQGKPLAESRGEVAYGASFIEWFAEEAKRVYGDTIPGHSRTSGSSSSSSRSASWRAITPWNFPQRDDHPQGGLRRLPPAAPVVMKPASQTPYSALALAELAERAGIAEGRVQRRHRIGDRDRRRADREPDRAQALVHRLDRGRQAADGAVRRHGEEAVARARRQRAVHRLRRRRSRCGRRRGDRLEVPQHRSDLRLRQPAARAGRGLRRVRRRSSPTRCRS